MRFLHTADWQIGKPFQSIEDTSKREALRRQRVDTVRGLKSVVEEGDLSFVVVCGDLFDSATPDKSTVSALCSAVGELAVPVYAIPGNHDHAGPGCIWQQAFFLSEQRALAPNLSVLLDSEPFLRDDAVLLPCPMERRHLSADPAGWLRVAPEGLPEDRPWIVLAHGSTQGFSSAGEDDGGAAINQVDLAKLPSEKYDYVALGDWHGMKQVAPNAWFCGTPEQDRFARGADNQPGHVLVVELQDRGSPPSVKPVRTGRIGWRELEGFQMTGDEDLGELESQLEAILGNRTGSDLLKLSARGTLSLAGGSRFEALVDSLESRLLRLRLEADLSVEPSAEELEELTRRQDPLISQVARELREAGEADPLSRDALRELRLQVMKVEGQG